jgi:hypothetical protein
VDDSAVPRAVILSRDELSNLVYRKDLRALGAMGGTEQLLHALRTDPTYGVRTRADEPAAVSQGGNPSGGRDQENRSTKPRGCFGRLFPS